MLCVFGENITEFLLKVSYQVAQNFNLSHYWWCLLNLATWIRWCLPECNVTISPFAINKFLWKSTLKLCKCTVFIKLSFIYLYLNEFLISYLMGYSFSWLLFILTHKLIPFLPVRAPSGLLFKSVWPGSIILWSLLFWAQGIRGVTINFVNLLQQCC